MKWTSTCLAGWMCLALCAASPLAAAPVVDTLRVDLDALIDKAARTPEQFALNLPHSVSSATQGSWSRRGSTSTWVYSTRVPTAISMSFHAPRIVLPPSAVLTVSTDRTTIKYAARDIGRRGLWARPLAGDTLKLSLTVNTAEASEVHVYIESVQAGYRSLGGGVPDHPHYQELKRAAQAASPSCTENYSCHATTANTGPAHATVAVIIGNLYQCTGTLLNDARGDGAPYVLTARHCEKGQLGGADPDAAAEVSVYWDAVTACGAELGSIYDSGTNAQSGASTVVEQQDIWLIQLDIPPVATDAFYAGWDATGSPFTGGYTIDHALGQDKQYVGWNGTAELEQIPGSTLSIAYDSTFWGVVNSVGNLGAGGSGSALFTPNNQVAGSASLALLTQGENSSGICPVSPPPAPTPSTATALFTALSGVWSSTTDRTSSTGATTLKSELDPAATGQLTNTGLSTTAISLTASSSFANSGDLVTLTWNAAGAESCTARGGLAGDGWAGAHAASGSLQVTNVADGAVNYSLSCLIGNEVGNGVVTVTWNLVTPLTNLTGQPPGPWTLGTQTQFNWDATVGPCVGTGGVSGDGWAGPQAASGTFALTVTQQGMTTYTLTCGTGARSVTNSIYIDGVAPQIWLFPESTQVRIGTPFQLGLAHNAGGLSTCSASGGSGNNDNWPNGSLNLFTSGLPTISEPAAGTFTYTLSCTGGGQSSTSSATVVVTADPPEVSLEPLAPQQQAGVASGFNLIWNSNVSNCSITNTGNDTGYVISFGDPSGAIADYQSQPQVVSYTMDCGNGLTASTTIDWVTTPVTSILSVSTDSWAGGVAYPITWNASAGPCVASGGASDDGWAGSKSTSGTQSVSEAQAGTYVFTLVCGSGAAAVTSNVAVNVPLPVIQIYSSSASSPTTALPETLVQWHSTFGPCTYVDGSSSNSAPVAVAPEGQVVPAPEVAGTYLFTLTCGSGPHTLSTATIAQVTPSIPTSLTASTKSTAVDSPVTITWNSAGGICYATGGDGTAPWTATLPGSGSGSLIVTSSSAGTLTYGINCNNELAQVAVTYVAVPATAASAPTPSVKLSASASNETAGDSVSLTWSSQNADACSASGGTSGDGWSGALGPSGSKSVTESSAGSVTYSITCSGAPPAAEASAVVVIANAPSGGTTSSSQGGGGGSLDLTLLLVLMLPVGVRLVRHQFAFASSARSARCASAPPRPSRPHQSSGRSFAARELGQPERSIS
jgi:hypothetical protein